MKTNSASTFTIELELGKIQADGYSWYAEDGKTIEYKLTEDIYRIQQEIAKKLNSDRLIVAHF